MKADGVRRLSPVHLHVPGRHALCRVAAVLAVLAAGSAPGTAQTRDNVGFKVIGAVIVWGADGPGNGALEPPVVKEFIIDTGSGTSALTSGDTDLIAGDANTVITGSLVPTFDAASGPATASTPFQISGASGGGGSTDSNGDGLLTPADTFDSFGVTEATDVGVNTLAASSSFYVASNVPFAIDAQAQFAGIYDLILLFSIRFEMNIVQSGTDSGMSFGSAAQYPHSGGGKGGVSTSVTRMNQLLSPRNVFTGNQRTAASRGSIAEQSVRFDVSYRIDNVSGYDLSIGTFDMTASVIYVVYVP